MLWPCAQPVAGRMAPSLTRCFSNLSVHRSHLENLFKPMAGPRRHRCRFCTSGQGGGGLTFLTSSQVTVMLLAQIYAVRTLV